MKNIVFDITHGYSTFKQKTEKSFTLCDFQIFYSQTQLLSKVQPGPLTTRNPTNELTG